MGLNGELRLTIRLPVAEAGEAEDKLVNLLLTGGGVGQRDGVGYVVDEGAGDGEVGGLGGEVVAARGGAGDRGDDWRRTDRYKLEDVRRARVGDERLNDAEVGLCGDEWCPSVDLLGIEERAALVGSPL